MKKIRVALLAVAIGCAGCAAKKPASYRWIGCKAVKAWTDSNGQQRNDFDCRNCKQIGLDAKTKAVIFRCE